MDVGRYCILCRFYSWINNMTELLNEIWIMRTDTGHFYPVQPSEKCRPEDHGKLNPHVVKIEGTDGRVLWERELQ
jgi:hypothetical protein